MRILLVGITILASLVPFLKASAGASPIPYKGGPRTETSPGTGELMVTTPTLRAGAQNTAAPADLEPKSFTALIGLQHLTRRLWPPPELAKPAPATAEPSISPERHQIAKEHNEVLRQIHWARVDYHIAGELDAQRRGDPDTVEHHYEHYICSYHKAKSHEFQRDIHGYHLDSLSNPQNARQNRQKVKELLPMVALHEAQADKRMALC